MSVFTFFIFFIGFSELMCYTQVFLWYVCQSLCRALWVKWRVAVKCIFTSWQLNRSSTYSYFSVRLHEWKICAHVVRHWDRLHRDIFELKRSRCWTTAIIYGQYKQSEMSILSYLKICAGKTKRLFDFDIRQRK